MDIFLIITLKGAIFSYLCELESIVKAGFLRYLYEKNYVCSAAVPDSSLWKS